jgi:hypothetical protein
MNSVFNCWLYEVAQGLASAPRNIMHYAVELNVLTNA